MTRDPHCDGCKADDAVRALRVLRRERDELRVELDELQAESFPATWHGLLAFLDAQYPTDVFGESTDPGPQIVRLAREVAECHIDVDRIRAQRDAAIAAVSPETTP